MWPPSKYFSASILVEVSSATLKPSCDVSSLVAIQRYVSSVSDCPKLSSASHQFRKTCCVSKVIVYFQDPSLQFSHLHFVLGWWDLLLHCVPFLNQLVQWCTYLIWLPLTSLWSLLRRLYDPNALAAHSHLSSRYCLQLGASTRVPASPAEYPWLHPTCQHLSWLWHVRISVFQYWSQCHIPSLTTA